MSQDAQSLISDDDVERFRRDGAVVLRQVFSPDWLDRLAQGIEKNLRLPGPMAIHYTGEDSPGRFFGDYCNWRRIPQYRYFITRSPAAEMAARLMGSEHAQFFHEHVLVKEPGTEEPTPWHHDLPYYCVDGDDTVSMWMPMDPVPEHVCPTFVAGSHRWGKLFYPRMFKDGENYDYEGAGYEPVPDIEGNPGDYEILSWPLEPGDALAFNYKTLHNAPPNPGPGRRRGFAHRWLGDDVRFCERPGKSSPPFPEMGVDLKPGDRMEGEWFPVIWPPQLIEEDAAE
jgi:ectoine hydroxylase-related dioxygenase (phytanoyl-CoA dioxygenase family)